MSSDKFYDFDQSHENQLEPKYNTEDLLGEDSKPVLCDNCDDGIKLVDYQTNLLICPRCMHVYNPVFDTIKHDITETTIDELQDTNSGTMSYVEDIKHTPTKTRIRRKLALDEDIPEYVKAEIDRIQWRAGYKTMPLDKANLSDSTR